MNRWKELNESALDVESVDLMKVTANLGNLLPKLGFTFRSMKGELRYTTANKEIMFQTTFPTISKLGEKYKLTRFDVIIMDNGDVVVNASDRNTKYLVTLERVGNIRTVSNLYKSNGIFKKQLEFATNEIKSNLE